MPAPAPTAKKVATMRMRMDLAGYVVNAVLVEGRSVNDVCEAHDISRSWLYELLARYRHFGDEGLKPQSRRPRSSPTRVPAAIEDESSPSERS